MKKKSFIPIVVTLLVVTIISFVYSCKDEPLDFTHSKVENQKSAKLETAKQWFRQNESGITFSKSGESIGKDGAYFPSFSGEPSWKYYAVTENENLEVIDVDLTDRINQDFILKNSFKNYKKNHQLKLRRSYTRYVHVKNKKTGKEQGFFMTIVPTPYYARTYSHRIRLNTYLKRDKYLGGYVLFHNFEGKFVNGWKYKKGKIVGRVLPNGVSTNPAKRKLALVKLKAKYIVKPQLYTPIKTKSGDESFYDDSWNNDDYDNTTVELDPLVAEGTNNDGWATDEDPDEGVNLYEEPEEEPLPEDDDPCPYNDCYDDNRGYYNDTPKEKEEDKEDPCEEMQKQLYNYELNKKIDTLKNNLNKKAEMGYKESRDGTFTREKYTKSDKDSDSVVFDNIDQNTRGFLHTHPNGYTLNNGAVRKGIKIFSPQDINIFISMIRNAVRKGFQNEIYLSVISSEGVFTLKFTGTEKEIPRTFTTKEIKGFKNAYLRYLKNKTGDELIKNFLSFMKNEMKVSGISLYKTTEEDKKVEEIKLNNNKTDLITIKCP